MVVEMKLKIIGIIGMVLVSVIALGCVESQPSQSTSTLPTLTSTPTPLKTPTPTPTQPKIEMVVIAPSQILPTINEMPSGSIKGSEKSDDKYASKEFVLTRIVTQSLKYEAYKFSSIDEAKEKYNSVIGKYSNYKLDTVNMGDEGVGFEIANSLATIVFRKANVVVQVQFVGQYTVNLRGAKSYAELVNTPTSYVTIATPTAIPTSALKLKLVADKKILNDRETWDIDKGYSLQLMILADSNPLQVGLRLLKDGKAISGNSYALIDGRVKRIKDSNVRTFIDDNIFSYEDIFSTKIESITPTEVVLRDTYIAS